MKLKHLLFISDLLFIGVLVVVYIYSIDQYLCRPKSTLEIVNKTDLDLNGNDLLYIYTSEHGRTDLDDTICYKMSGGKIYFQRQYGKYSFCINTNDGLCNIAGEFSVQAWRKRRIKATIHIDTTGYFASVVYKERFKELYRDTVFINSNIINWK